MFLDLTTVGWSLGPWIGVLSCSLQPAHVANATKAPFNLPTTSASGLEAWAQLLNNRLNIFIGFRAQTSFMFCEIMIVELYFILVSEEKCHTEAILMFAKNDFK